MNITLKISYHITSSKKSTKMYFNGITFNSEYYAILNNNNELVLEPYQRFDKSKSLSKKLKLINDFYFVEFNTIPNEVETSMKQFITYGELQNKDNCFIVSFDPRPTYYSTIVSLPEDKITRKELGLNPNACYGKKLPPPLSNFEIKQLIQKMLFTESSSKLNELRSSIAL